ncbi:MAG: DUF3501 family protein [Myxococcales bacterium]|nr:DUF3501 family protein [Myxococcales bacterium]
MSVQRSDILDYETYGDARPEIRARVLQTKALRRIPVADVLTFLFENHETIRYQILEMVRTERIVREADIVHEIRTYNELLGGPGELGCTLLICIDDPAERDVKLRAWLDLLGRLYVKVEGGERIRATWDPRQVGDDRLSSVQYLKFPLGARAPVAVGVDHPELTAETELSAEQRAALVADLAEAAAASAS